MRHDNVIFKHILFMFRCRFIYTTHSRQDKQTYTARRKHKAHLFHLLLQVLLLLALSEAASQITHFPLHRLTVLVPLGSLLIQTLVELDLILADCV